MLKNYTFFKYLIQFYNLVSKHIYMKFILKFNYKILITNNNKASSIFSNCVWNSDVDQAKTHQNN